MFKSPAAALLLFASLALGRTMAPAAEASAVFGPQRPTPNLEGRLERPLRYSPDGSDFVIVNGGEFFNRPLYGGNTAFRVDGGDRPEFVLYLPGRGGNLRLGFRRGEATKWLHDAARVETRYRPGMLLYEISDPSLGEGTKLEISAIACAETEGLILRAQLTAPANSDPGVELFWAYGGANGQRGKRDGDIGTENVPISQWFQLQPEFSRGNAFTFSPEGFILRAKTAVIAGVMPPGALLALADASAWDHPKTLLAAPAAGSPPAPPLPLVVGRVPVTAGVALYLSLQRLRGRDAKSADIQDLDTYRAVTAPPPGEPPRDGAVSPIPPAAATPPPAATRQQAGGGSPAPFARSELPDRFRAAERHFRELRQRVSVDTPDPFLNAAVGALNVAADAVWDEPQQAIMHGAIAWRTRLLGWRGPYVLDELGWHERARRHFSYWATRQNLAPVPAQLPPADEKANLARNEAGLHSNGDLSNSHYDMNLVYIDALFRHLAWTGDLAFAREIWPVIERHLAWERRLFRREFGPEKLPLYEAYAAIWASDDLQYSGGGTTHASAYNYFHNVQAARLARLIGADPAPYENEAGLIARAMRKLLWRADATSDATADNDTGGFGEYRDLLGLQRLHPSAALWSFYHTLDAGLLTPREGWQFSAQILRETPFLPVCGPGVPAGLAVPATTNWMPYRWSINNVVLSEIAHTALGFWQAGRPEEAWNMTKGALLASMYMGISPGNVGSMSYLDVYRRESQRDFADGSGTLSRALVEGLFGLRSDLLAGELKVEPGFPAVWSHATLRHPDVSLRFTREGDTDHYVITQKFGKQLSLRLRLLAPRAQVESLSVNGDAATWHWVQDCVGAPQIVITSPAGGRHEILVTWSGKRSAPAQPAWTTLAPAAQNPAATRSQTVAGPDVFSTRIQAARFETIDLSGAFNDRVTQIFRNEYRSPRSPFVSLALPKQGLGGWAGGVNASADIDDSGLRASSAREGGHITLPGGLPFSTPAAPDARNVIFTSLWDNYPSEVTLPLAGQARALCLLLAGSTNHMQSRIENGEVVVTYTDQTTARLSLENPTTWWPIEQDYFVDDYQFRRPGPLPTRIDLKTGHVRELEPDAFKGRGGPIPGGAATVLTLPLDPAKELQSLTLRTLANEVVIGLLSATLAR